MAQWLRQSTAAVIPFGPFVDKTDGVTLEVGLITALDHATTGIKLSKNGGALAVRHATVTATTYDSYGYYLVTLDTTDTATLGRLRMMFEEAATCLPVWQDFQVLPANVYDSLVAGSDLLDVNVGQWLGTAAAAPTVAGVPKVEVDSLSTAGETAVQGAAEDALETYKLDHLIHAAVDTNFQTTVHDNSVIGYLAATSVTSGFDRTTESLQSMRDASITASSLVDDIWNEEVTVGHTTADTAGAKLNAAGAAGDPWATAVPGAYGAGTAGLMLGTTLPAAVAAVKSDTAEIGVAGAGLTNINLPNQTMDITGSLSGSVGSVTGAVGSVTGAVGSVTGDVGGNVVGSVGSVTGAVGSVTGAVGSVTGAVGSVTAGVTVTTNNDKTGYTVSTVSDKTGYSLTQAFPTNFADLAITATTGKVTVGTNDDKTGYTASTVSDKTGYSLAASQTGVTIGTVNTLTNAPPDSAGVGTLLTDVAAVKGDTAAILLDTAEIGAAGAGLTVLAQAADLATAKTVIDTIAVDVAGLDGEAMRGTDGAALATALATAQTDLDTLTGTAGAVVDADSLTAIADAVLKRDWTAVSLEPAYSLINAGRILRNKWTITGTALSVKKENGTDEAWAATLSTDASSTPIIGMTP